MKNYFVLTYSKECDVETVQNAVEMLNENFEIPTIGLPEVLHLQDYAKEDLIKLLEAYSDCIKELIYESSE